MEGWREGTSPRTVHSSLDPPALQPRGKGQESGRQTDDETGKREFLKREDQTRMTLFSYSSFEMESDKHEQFSFHPITLYNLGHFTDILIPQLTD